MLRIQPLAIIADGADQYRVRCKQDGELVEFTFNMDPASRGITNSPQEYYYVTYDDPSAEWLGRAILTLDEARFSGIALPQLGGAALERISLFADGDEVGIEKYRVVFEGGSHKAEQSFSITGTDQDKIIDTENGVVTASRKDGPSWNISCDDLSMKPLFESILRLHEARRQ